VLAGCLAAAFSVGVLANAAVVIGLSLVRALGAGRGVGAVIVVALAAFSWGLMGWLLGLAHTERGHAPRSGRAICIDGLLFVDQHASWAFSMMAVVLVLAVYQDASWVLPPGVLVAGVIASSLVASLLGLMAMTSVVGRWSVPVPSDLQALLDHVAERTGVRFARVLYFDDRFAKRPIMEVRAGWTGHRLLLSERALAPLSPDEQLAVLAHETAHVKYRHTVKELFAVGAVSWSVLMLARPVTAALFTHAAAMGISFVVVLSILNMACRNALRRRWERQADAYASRVAGGPLLAAALRKMLPDGPEPLWWTHDPRDVRIRRLEETGV
jgi:Zn-dependent protease with chaperone function